MLYGVVLGCELQPNITCITPGSPFTAPPKTLPPPLHPQQVILVQRWPAWVIQTIPIHKCFVYASATPKVGG
jgi:hypothetical protein